MKLRNQSLALFAFATIVGCSDGFGGRSHQTAENAALKQFSIDPEYRQAVGDYRKYGELGEKDAFQKVIESDTHASYIAFLHTFPDSEYLSEVNLKLKDFKLFKTNEPHSLDAAAIESMCWPNVSRIGHWKEGGLVGMMTGGPQTFFGPMMIWSQTGSIQLLSGSFVATSDGYDLSAGTSFIYQQKCLNE